MSDILILTHIDYCPPGHLAKVLDEAHLDFHTLRVDLGELDGVDLDRPKAVAIMGGPMAVNDPLPWLATEIAALHHFIRRDIPLIGHCLGGQLLAKALGAEISRMAYTESGWQLLEQAQGAASSPLVGPCAAALSGVPVARRHLLAAPWCAAIIEQPLV